MDSARSALDGHVLFGLSDEHGGDEQCLVPARRLNGHVLDGCEHGDHLQTPAGDHPFGDELDGVHGGDGRLVPARQLDDPVLLDLLDNSEHVDHLHTPAGDHPLGDERDGVHGGGGRLQGKRV